MQTPSTRTFVATLISLSVVLNLVVGYLLISAAQDNRHHREAETRVKIESLAETVDQQISGEIQRIDVSLREIAGSLEQELASAAGPSRAAIQTSLARSRDILGSQVGLSLVDADGRSLESPAADSVAAATGTEEPTEANPSQADDGLIVGMSTPDADDGRGVIRLSRPYRKPDGKVAGFVAASLPVAMLSSALANLNLGSQGIAELRDSTNRLVIQYAPIADDNALPDASERQRGETALTASDPPARADRPAPGEEDVERISANRPVSALPLHLTIGIGSADYLTPWRAEVLNHSLLGGLFLLLSTFSAALMWSQFRRAEANRGLLRSLMDSIPDLVWLKDPNGVYIACNPRFEQFFGKREADIVGRDDYHFMDRELADFFRNNDSLAVQADGPRMNDEWLTFADNGYHGLFETIKTPMKTAEGRLVGVLGVARDITRQQEATEALRIREDLYSSIVSQAGVGILLIDPETCGFVEFNDAAHELLGYGREEFARLRLFDLPAELAPEQTRALVADTLTQGEGRFEIRQRHKDGSDRDTWISYRTLQIRGRTLINAIWHDITAEKQAEEALREERRLRETIMESIPGVCYALDQGGHLIYWNRTLERIADCDTATLNGMNALEFFEGGDRDWIAQRIGEAFAAPEASAAVDADATLVAHSGRRIPFHFSSRRVHMGGQPVLVGVGIDVSARKDAEDALKRLNAELEERVLQRTAALESVHAKLVDTQFAMDSVGIGITWADFETGRFVHANRYSAEFLGYSLDELLKLHVPDIDPNFPPDAYARIAQEIKERGHIQMETEQLTKDGRRLPVEMTVYYHAGRGGAEPRLIGFMSDIARRKEVEAALVQAKEASEAASAAKSEFLANMSHEIRTPLNAILGLNYLLKKEGATAVQLERLDKMEIAGRHLLSLINDILDLSKIEADRMDLEQSNFHLSAVLDNVASIIRDSAANKGLALEIDADGVPLWLCGDVTRLRQALLNFASNAVKFTERGTVALRSLLLEEEDDDLQVRFEVEDTGIGLSVEQKERLFQAFEQADGSTSRKFGGTGLGLALTKRLVELMGGQVGLESTTDVGSTFWFSVPLKRGHGPVPILPSAAIMTGAEPQLRALHRGARILLAEDNAINVEVVLEMLHAVGIDVTVAENGREAVERARHQTFDLILMDMQMPELGGIEAARLIRTLPQWADRPVIALTANAFAEDRQACLAAGMNDMLTKPVEPELLYAALLQWLAPSARGERELGLPPAASEPETHDQEHLLESLRQLTQIDIDTGLALLRGNREKYLRLVSQLVDSQTARMAEIERILDAGDHPAARRTAHSLKGAAGTLGLTAVAEAALRVEQMLKKEEDVASLRDAIRAGVSEIQAELRAIELVISPARQPK